MSCPRRNDYQGKWLNQEEIKLRSFTNHHQPEKQPYMHPRLMHKSPLEANKYGGKRLWSISIALIPSSCSVSSLLTHPTTNVKESLFTGRGVQMAQGDGKTAMHLETLQQATPASVSGEKKRWSAAIKRFFRIDFCSSQQPNDKIAEDEKQTNEPILLSTIQSSLQEADAHLVEVLSYLHALDALAAHSNNNKHIKERSGS